MVSERFPSDDPREWLNRARSNLIQARGLQPGVYLEDLCFNAQQAAEKAIKALLIHHGVPFPYIHDLTKLLDLLQEAGERCRNYEKIADLPTGHHAPGEVLDQAGMPHLAAQQGLP